MANLDLNEAENEWRQQKINEIKETVAENTIYGNSYAALDDIITKAGNLASDQGMIGRLQAQKDYKAFRERVENDKTLPDKTDQKFLQMELNHLLCAKGLRFLPDQLRGLRLAQRRGKGGFGLAYNHSKEFFAFLS